MTYRCNLTSNNIKGVMMKYRVKIMNSVDSEISKVWEETKSG